MKNTGRKIDKKQERNMKIKIKTITIYIGKKERKREKK